MQGIPSMTAGATMILGDVISVTSTLLLYSVALFAALQPICPMCLLLCISPFPLTYAGRDGLDSIRRGGQGPDPRMVVPGEARGAKSVTQPLAPAFLGTNDDQCQVPALQPRSGWVRVTVMEL